YRRHRELLPRGSLIKRWNIEHVEVTHIGSGVSCRNDILHPGECLVGGMAAKCGMQVDPDSEGACIALRVRDSARHQSVTVGSLRIDREHASPRRLGRSDGK